LQIENTSTENALRGFGIRPRALESVVPTYLCGSVHQDQLSCFREKEGR